MVESGQEQIRPVDFATRLHPRLPVEVIERHELLARIEPANLAMPQRPSFDLLLLMRSHRGSHTVDFTEIPARPGRLIRIRPGQIQVFNTEVDTDATLVLSQPAMTSTHPWFPGDVAYADLDGVAMTTAETIVGALRHQQTRFDGDQPTTRLMIALFDALVALFDQAHADTSDTHLPEVYVSFRNAIETDLARRHDVIDYARHLGYSARTISRSCQQATGQTAKRILTDRLVLEAKRLLVHTDTPAATISSQLGFSEPTNFTKFFARNTAQTPSAFRRHHRQTAIEVKDVVCDARSKPGPNKLAAAERGLTGVRESGPWDVAPATAAVPNAEVVSGPAPPPRGPGDTDRGCGTPR